MGMQDPSEWNKKSAHLSGTTGVPYESSKTIGLSHWVSVDWWAAEWWHWCSLIGTDCGWESHVYQVSRAPNSIGYMDVYCAPNSIGYMHAWHSRMHFLLLLPFFNYLLWHTLRCADDRLSYVWPLSGLGKAQVSSNELYLGLVSSGHLKWALSGLGKLRLAQRDLFILLNKFLVLKCQVELAYILGFTCKVCSGSLFAKPATLQSIK